MHNIASTLSNSHSSEPASNSIGGRILGKRDSAVHAAMDDMPTGSGSLGCHMIAGKQAAKCTICSPVPLAISKTRPDGGNILPKTPAMASRFRNVAGAKRFASLLSSNTKGFGPGMSSFTLQRSQSLTLAIPAQAFAPPMFHQAVCAAQNAGRILARHRRILPLQQRCASPQ
jgi:hypothetical protein